MSSANAGAMADALYATFVVPLDLSDLDVAPLPAPGEWIDTVQAGPNGGTVHVTGRAAANGTGWIAGRFTGYRDGDTTIDGLQLEETLQLPSQGNGQQHQHRLSFGDLRIRAVDADLTVTGSITRTLTGGTSDRSVAGTVLVRDNLAGLTFYAQDFAVTRTVSPSTGDYALSGTGRAFDSRYGYVDVQSQGPWHFRLNETIAHHGAAFRGVGSGGRYLQLTPLSPDVASIEYVGPGATQPTFAARVSWQEGFEEQTTRQLLSAPVADGGASSFQRPGRTVVLDSRFTSHPQTAFVSSRWTLLFQPPGSAAALDDPQLTRPQLTLDIEGRYVIGLEVGDGVRTDRDVIVLTADANVSTLFTPVNAQLTPDERVMRGTITSTIAIDLSQLQHTSFDNLGPQLSLDSKAPPNGSAAQFTQQDQKSATFQPGVAGVYEFVWSQGPLSLVDALVRDMKWIAVDSPMPYAPAGAAYLGPGDPAGLASGDLNADGFADLVATMRDGDGNPLMHVFYGNVAGLLEPAVTLPVSNDGSVAIGDVSSDGLADIVLTTGLGMSMLLQGPAGTFGGELSVPAHCFVGGGERDFALADLNGDGRLDVVSHGCFGELDYYLQAAAGGLQPPARVPAPETTALGRMAVGDLNGDGVADVVLNERSFATAPNIFAIYGVDGALPGAPVPLPYQSTVVHNFVSAVALADVNRDGRLDVISGENPQPSGVNFPRLMTFLQQANGSFGAPNFTSAGPAGTRELAAHDLNRDGVIDLATMGSGQGLNVLYGAGSSFGAPIADLRPTVTLVNKHAFPEAVLDLNRDGLLDFAYLTGDGRRVILAVALGSDD